MDCFNKQLIIYRPITEEVFNKIVFKRVWSGNLMKIGDIILYAFVFDVKDDQLKLISILNSELTDISNTFDFVAYKNNIIPVLKFKYDTKKREYQDVD